MDHKSQCTLALAITGGRTCSSTDFNVHVPVYCTDTDFPSFVQHIVENMTAWCSCVFHAYIKYAMKFVPAPNYAAVSKRLGAL